MAAWWAVSGCGARVRPEPRGGDDGAARVVEAGLAEAGVADRAPPGGGDGGPLGVEAGSADADVDADAGAPDRANDASAPPPARVVQISSSPFQVCARDIAGAVRCWDGEAAPRGAGFEAAEQLAAGGEYAYHTSFFACAARAGAAFCVGDNETGQLGDGTTTARATPVRVDGAPPDVVALAAARTHACALARDGRVACWGDDTSEQLGDGARTARSHAELVAGVSSVVALAAGELTTCGARADGTVVCWGHALSGDVRAGTSPPQLVAGVRDATRVAVGARHACAVRADATVVCWGANDYGQLGAGDAAPHAAPVVVEGLYCIERLAAGRTSTCAVQRSGRVLCWGMTEIDPTGAMRPSPAVPAAFEHVTDAVDLSIGVGHVCVLRRDGEVVCAGGLHGVMPR